MGRRSVATGFGPGTAGLNLARDVTVYSWFAVVFLVVVFIRGFYNRLETFFDDFAEVVDFQRFPRERYASLVAMADRVIAGKGRASLGRMGCYALGLGGAVVVGSGLLIPAPTGETGGGPHSRGALWCGGGGGVVLSVA